MMKWNSSSQNSLNPQTIINTDPQQGEITDMRSITINYEQAKMTDDQYSMYYSDYLNLTTNYQ